MFGEVLNEGQRFFPIFHQFASSATFHHRIGGATCVELNSREKVTILTFNFPRSFYQSLLVASIDLGDGLLIGSSLEVVCHLFWIDEKTVNVHKFSSERKGVVGMSEFVKNFLREKSGCTGSDSVHWSEAEIHQ
jgi:hypothetical protein